MQIADYRRVRGKMDGRVPSVGELHPETVESVIRAFAGLDPETATLPTVPGRRPTLCAGCPHRASFFAVKKAAPKGIYTSDIGCYTLGMNLGAVDTVLCMGAAISQAAGFYHAHRHLEKRPDIVATIGDSTFFHAGVPALIDAVSQNARFVLLILDNRTTAMTGNQPTPATGVGAMGEPLAAVDMETLVAGCGVQFVRTADPYDLAPFIDLLKEAVSFSRQSGPAVVIARHPCLLDRRSPASERTALRVVVSDDCDGCGFCLKHFECPAIVGGKKGEPVRIDPMICSGCGVCLSICRSGAIVVEETPD
jgi:indolepyruvate ferredoxin oxidoreductase alpha subunit